MESFNLKKLNEVEGKEQYSVEISNRFAALENLDTEVDVNKAWETIRENVRFEVSTAVTMMIIIFLEMTPCVSYKNRSFGESYRFHLQGVRVRAST
jgi:hypothetical protein